MTFNSHRCQMAVLYFSHHEMDNPLCFQSVPQCVILNQWILCKNKFKYLIFMLHSSIYIWKLQFSIFILSNKTQFNNIDVHSSTHKKVVKIFATYFYHFLIFHLNSYFEADWIWKDTYSRLELRVSYVLFLWISLNTFFIHWIIDTIIFILIESLSHWCWL